ncbi:MAG: PSD1 and planctomycete cytochrome C domain-containing protein [Verrucomicrobiota bacterium]
MLLSFGGAILAHNFARAGEDFEFFEKTIRPILVDRCYKCHSESADKIKGGLRLDSKENILKGGESGPAIVPKQPEKSLLIKAIRYTDHDLQMPPKKALSSEQIKSFETWVKMGAPDPRVKSASERSAPKTNEAQTYWAFQPVKNQPPPPIKNKEWVKNPIDQFILAQLETQKMVPGLRADKLTLIRRATFDLIGLPPTPGEIDNFLSDKSINAFEKIVDRLLASPHYGERWGRHWLDVVRYADTSGCNSDYPIPAAYKYRNYVIQSFNRDKPFDQFVREQIAGDLMPGANDEETFERIIATGYLATSRRFGSRNNEFHLTIEDTIDNMGKAVLGLSLGCARCHDHKFDPVSSKDYYALYGIFSSTRYAFPGTEIYRHPKDFVPLAIGTNVQFVIEYQEELAALDEKIDKLQEQKRLLEKPAKEEKKKAAEVEEEKEELDQEAEDRLLKIKAELEDAKTRQKKLEAHPPPIEKAYAVAEGKSSDAKIQKKGDPQNLGEKVPRGFLQILGGQQLPSAEQGSGRAELAKWLTDPQNPLTARVMVNRVWQHHFGRGLVETANDFGARGKAPSHPELLDYLATQFQRGGWSIKQMHKLMMLSQTYQTSSVEQPDNSRIDPGNNLFWKFNRRRLDAEQLRDAMLAVSGMLDPTVGMEHPFPKESEWRYTQHTPFVAVYDTNRRGVYLMQQRIKKQPFLEVFDGADPNATTDVRPVSTTPIQALFMMNDPFAHEQADKFAIRIALAHVETPKRINDAYRLAFGRSASRDELKTAKEYLQQCARDLKETDLALEKQPRAAWASYCRVLLSSNEFLFLD